MKKQILPVALFILCGLSLSSCYDFNREQAEKDAESKGKQTLLEAESSKKAKIEEAKADLESAKLDAETKKVRAEADATAQIIRSKAKAEAIQIEAEAIGGKEQYLKMKQIEAMYTKGKFVYIPTEAGLPILEAKNN